MRKLTSILGVCAMVTVLAANAFAATVTINNMDGPGEGFNDLTAAAPVGGNAGVTIGQQRLIAFTYAANIWAACLQSAVPIIVNAQMNPLACNAGGAVLGSAGATTVHANFAGAPLTNVWYPQALANSLAGFDLDPANPDISAQFNSNLGNVGCLTGIPFYYGLDHNPPPSTIDFVSVVLHEICHGLGFQTFVNSAGQRLAGLDDHYMIYLEQHGANPFWYPQMTDAQRAAAHISDPNLHWTGPIVTNRGLMHLSAGMSDGHVRMHGPNPYVSGSSVSHWSTALTPNEIMEPAYTAANHEPGLAWALLDEIGWTLCSQPENGCNGAVVDLTPPTGPKNNAPDTFQERGIYVTALKDFNVCSLGMEGDFVPGQTLTARIYAATGTTRGALLASGSTTIAFDGLRVHYVPISYTLQKCKEYDITIEFQNANGWPWWDETFMTKRPWDADGVIRLRDGELLGNAGNSAVAHFQLRGSTAVAENQNNMLASATGAASIGPEHGAFVTAKRTISLSKLGVRVQYSAAPGVLRAYVYEAAGNVRGNLVSEGMAAVPNTAGQVITVPINAVLEEGRQYNIGFDFGTYSTRYIHIEALPWQFSDLLQIDGVERAGTLDGASQQVPNFEVTWAEGPGLSPLDIVGPWLGTPDGTSSGGFNFGKFVQAVATQDFTGVGFYADLPPGTSLVANVYNAAGTVRGSLISTGTTTSVQTGTRWHDIPVSARLVAGQDYDIEIVWSAATSFPYWAGVTTQPYTAYGILKVVVGEFGGVPDPAQECAQFRVYSCPVGSLTTTGPTPTPAFALHEAFPNPFSGTATIGYELDAPATVSMAVYDVAGRKVADLVKSKAMPKGSGQLSIDSSNLVSGIYFVKMSTPGKSVTRKITIIR